MQVIGVNDTLNGCHPFNYNFFLCFDGFISEGFGSFGILISYDSDAHDLGEVLEYDLKHPE